MINLDYLSFTGDYITKSEIEKYDSKIEQILNTIQKKQSMLDWFDIDTTVSEQEIEQIKNIAKEIRENDAYLVVVGAGGSFLGAKAVIETFSPYFGNNLSKVLFAGYDLSSEYLSELLSFLSDKNFYINVISKSGNTMETSIAFKFLLQLLKEKYPNDYKNKVIATTDKQNGKLRKISQEEGFRTMIIPSEIGGRYSVLTPVGLFPIAVAGVDIDKLLEGAKAGKQSIHSAMEYAVARDILYNKGFFVESFTNYEKRAEGIALWRQQLFAETQGKNKSGILPICNANTTNLHSVGQYYQDGPDILFESVLKIDKLKDLKFKNNDNFSLFELNNIVLKQVALAHLQGNTPSIILTIPELNEFNIGEFIYYNFISAAVGAYLQQVNPFDQPGVEAYKNLVKQNASYLLEQIDLD